MKKIQECVPREQLVSPRPTRREKPTARRLKFMWNKFVLDKLDSFQFQKKPEFIILFCITLKQFFVQTQDTSLNILRTSTEVRHSILPTLFILYFMFRLLWNTHYV